MHDDLFLNKNSKVNCKKFNKKAFTELAKAQQNSTEKSLQTKDHQLKITK